MCTENKRKITSLIIVLLLLLSVLSSVFANEPPNNILEDHENLGYVPGQLLVGMEETIELNTDVRDIAVPDGNNFAELFAGVEIVSAKDLTCFSQTLMKRGK